MSNAIISSGREWFKEVLSLYEQGASDSEVAASLRVTLKEYHKTISENAKFAALVDLGRTLSQAFWEGMARKHVTNKGFNSAVWSFYMKNKYGWADKTEALTEGGSGNQDLDALRAEIKAETMKFIKQYTPELTDAERVLKSMKLDD